MATPALPDTERRTTYSISAQVGPFDVGFHIYGDATDYQDWVEVWLNDVKLVGGVDWVLGLASGTIATAPRPLQNARITLTSARTGTLQIVGARRPRRLIQFTENQGVTARDFNVALTDVVAENREDWDHWKRTFQFPPGSSIAVFPPASSRANTVLGFDANGTPAMFQLPIGGGVSLLWSTSTVDGDPGGGNLRGNDIAFASISQLFIDNVDRVGGDISSTVDFWGSGNNLGSRGTLFIQSVTDQTRWMAYSINGAIVIASGYRKIPVQPLGQHGFPFLSGEQIMVAFSPAGERGAPGAGTGDVVGPTGAIGDHFATYNGSTGKIIKDSGIAVSSIRTKLTGNTVLFVKTTGNDSTGDGSKANPFATPIGGYQRLQQSYDLGGFPVVFRVRGGNYTASNQATGPLVGYAGVNGSGCIFLGDDELGTTFFKPSAGVPLGGYSFSAVSGAEFGLCGMKFDSTDAGIDQVVMGARGTIGLLIPITNCPWAFPSGSVTVTIASPGVFTAVAHELPVGWRIVFATSGALPTGITAGVTYFIKTVPTADTFTVSATSGGAAINTSGTQSGTHSFTSKPAYNDTGLIFGDGLYGFGGNNDISCSQGIFYVDGGYKISKSTLATTGDVTVGNNTITNLASMTGIKQYMGVRGSGIPAGAYVNSIGANSVTLAYVQTAPATAPTGSFAGTLIGFDYGGQCHLLEGDGAHTYYNTNGDPNFEIIITVLGIPMYTSAFHQTYIGATSNYQGIRFKPSAALGAGGGVGNCCPFAVQRRGVIDTNFGGEPYHIGTVGNINVTTITLTAGSKAAVLAANVGVIAGSFPSIARHTTGTWSAVQTVLTLASVANILVGDKIVGEGIRAATVVTNVNGGASQVTLSHPTAEASGGVTDVWTINCPTSSPVYLEPGTFVEAVSGVNITLSKPARNSVAGAPVYVAGFIDTDGLRA